MAYDRFHLGYKQMDLAPDEIITRVHLRKRPVPWIEHYRKVGTRRAQAISKVCLAVVADGGPVVRDVRIALNSVAPTVIRCRRAEDAIVGRALDRAAVQAAAAALAADITPIDDVRSTARYRARVARQLLEECLSGALAPGTA